MNETYYQGFLMKTGIKNKNGRIYPPEVFAHAVNKYLKRVNSGTAFGELGHPDRSDILFTNISHRIESVKCVFPKVPRKLKKKMKKAGTYVRDTYITNCHILNTEKGKAAKSILNDLVPSPRGTGSIDANGVVSDYTLLSIDLIHKKDRA
jgi:hypothetical protein